MQELVILVIDRVTILWVDEEITNKGDEDILKSRGRQRKRSLHSIKMRKDFDNVLILIRNNYFLNENLIFICQKPCHTMRRTDQGLIF